MIFEHGLERVLEGLAVLAVCHVVDDGGREASRTRRCKAGGAGRFDATSAISPDRTRPSRLRSARHVEPRPEIRTATRSWASGVMLSFAFGVTRRDRDVRNSPRALAVGEWNDGASRVTRSPPRVKAVTTASAAPASTTAIMPIRN